MLERNFRVNQQEKEICAAWQPVSDDPAWKWISENVELPADSELKNFDFELFPLAKFVLENLCHNPRLKRFTEMLSAQVGKTVTVLAYLCWKIVNRPSSVGWYTDTGINAKHDYKTKILPALEDCGPVVGLLPADRAKKNNTLIQFGFMNLRVMGAESRSNREGKTISEVLCDECRNYPPGAMEQIDNRFKTITNYRRILFSSAGEMTQEPWPSFERGTRHLGFWKCPACQHKQTFRFGRNESPLYPARREAGGFIWDDNATTHPSDDVYDFARLTPTIRYECEHCKKSFAESEKISLIRDVKFEQTNPMAGPDDISVHCWEAYMPFSGCSWANIVMKFLRASVAMRHGNILPMKVFVTETLGEPWEDRGEKPETGDIVKCCGEYSIGEEWPSEIKCARQITCDIQHGFVVYNYSIFNRGGEKRTVETGKLATLDEIRAFQLAKKVMDAGVGVDCAHKPADVFVECLKYGAWIPDKTGGTNHIWNGWRPLNGDDAEDFTSWIFDNTKTNNKVAIKTAWKAVLINANEGRSGKQRPIYKFMWSNPHYKTELYFRRIKGIGPRWEIPKNVSAEYVKQLSCTERRDVLDAEGRIVKREWVERGRHDDADCELMQLVLAGVNGLTK